MSGIQYYHECESAAAREQQAKFDQKTVTELEKWKQTKRHLEYEDIADLEYQYTEEGLAQLKASLKSYREGLHRAQAVELAKQAQILESADQNEWAVKSSDEKRGTEKSLENLLT